MILLLILSIVEQLSPMRHVLFGNILMIRKDLIERKRPAWANPTYGSLWRCLT
jgi:hypothetical protein